MKTQTESVPGLSEKAKLKRKNNNLVTMKYNLIISILSIVSSLIFLIIRNRISTMVLLFVISCGSPIVYLMGIEENRKNTKKLLKLKLEIFDKKESTSEEVNQNPDEVNQHPEEVHQHPELEPPMINNWM